MRRLFGSTLLALAAAGCQGHFEPRHELDRYQVIGIVADRPEPGPEDVVRLTVVDHLPAGETSTYAWSVCLYAPAAAGGYPCADPGLEVPLPDDRPKITLDLGPGGLDLRARYEALGPFPGADGEPLTFDDGVPIRVRLRSGPTGASETVKTLRVREGGTPNRNPTLTGLRVGEREAPADEPLAVEAGVALTLVPEVAPDAAEAYTDPETGEGRVETLTFTWFATGGELERGLTFDDAPETTWSAPAEPGDVTLYVAARDGRGGLAVLERALRVTPAEPSRASPVRP